MLDYGVSPGLAVILATGGAVAISTFLHFVVEIPTQRIGKRQLATDVSGELAISGDRPVSVDPSFYVPPQPIQ